MRVLPDAAGEEEGLRAQRSSSLQGEQAATRIRTSSEGVDGVGTGAVVRRRRWGGCDGGLEELPHCFR